MLLTRTPSRATSVAATIATALAATLAFSTPARADADPTGVIRGTVLETGHVMTPSPAMAVAHLVALVAVAAGIAKVEQLWWSWWDRVTLLVRLFGRSVPVLFAEPVPSVPRAREHGGVLAHVVVRRGPPAA